MCTLTRLLRALIRRCPNCGSAHIFCGWFAMEECCPRCGLRFEREEGYWTGAIAIDTIVTELLFAVMMLIVLIRTWPEIPMVRLLAASVAFNVLFPIFFYPFSKTLWLALDLAVRPRAENERSGEYW